MNEKNDKSEKNEGPGVVQGVYQTYRAEFKKIVWPSRETLTKHTFTVIVVSLMFGAYIAAADGLFGWLYGLFVNLVT
jgi:preprotein translocase subunit SecE